MEKEVEDTYREPIPTIVYLDFWISDFPMKHEELTELLGIQPTEVENVGDEFYNKSKKKIDYLAYNSWKLSSNIGKEKPIEEHILHIFNILFPKKDIIKSVCSKIEHGSLNLLMFKDPDFREFFEIEPRILKELGEMNISFSVNIYSGDGTD